MKIKQGILHFLHLDKTYSMLSGKNVFILQEYFKLLDVHNEESINGKQTIQIKWNIPLTVTSAGCDLQKSLYYHKLKHKITGIKVLVVFLLLLTLDIQFYHFLHAVCDLNRGHIYNVFDMLDVDGSGRIDFDEFYLLVCILISLKVGYSP